MSRVAKRFDVTPLILGQICDANGVPRPTRDCWSRRVAGLLQASDEPPDLPEAPIGLDQVNIQKPRTKADEHRDAWQALRDRTTKFAPKAATARKPIKVCQCGCYGGRAGGWADI